MAKIQSIDLSSESPLVTLALSKEEYSELRGEFEDLVLLSCKGMTTTRITKRGKDDATTYILLPKELRNRLEGDVKIGRLDRKDSSFVLIRIPHK
jgi:hypothetical protein